MDFIRASTLNATSFLNPSPKDLVLAIPRAIARLGSFAFISVPERVDDLMGLRNGGSVIAEATGERGNKTVLAALSGVSSAQGAAVTALNRATMAGGAQGGVLSHAFSFQQVRNFGGVFTYMTSRWALGCFALAIILNRTSVYASLRRPLRLGFPLRLLLRIMPIIMFLFHTKSLLEAIRCQTSPQFSMLKYGNPDRYNNLDYAGDGGLLYYLSSTLLFWKDDVGSCLAVDMIEATPTPTLFSRRGSLSLLWPLFQSICFSHFVETLSCAIQGRHVMTETGMSIFEHSLAFAEAEAMISNQLGLSPFGVPKVGIKTAGDSELSEAIGLLSKSVLFGRLNTPPEVLLMGLISSLNHLTSHILGVLNVQGRFRLLNTGIWGLCFMSSFVWGFFSFTPDAGADAVILRFPTVCIVGFIPHLLVFIGVCMCAGIYFLAMLLSVFSPASGLAQVSIIDRLKMAHQNLQATSQLSSLRLSMHEDFYTALLKTGFTVLTVASEAVYLNEGLKIRVSRLTWLEEQRTRELEASHLPANGIPHEFTAEVATGITLMESNRSQSSQNPRLGTSGYGREKTTKILRSGPNGRNSRMAADGVGSLQRGDRYIMAWHFFAGLFRLMTGVLALVLIRMLDFVGISRKPGWLSNTRNASSSSKVQEGVSQAPQPHSLEFWLLSEGGVLSLPENDDVDVEAETKKRLVYAADHWGEEEERKLDSTLYGWWINGGWWGERDGSGTYQVPGQDDDITSIISASTHQSESEAGWESDDDNESGRQTPTQQQYHHSNRDPSPVLDHAIDPSHLARLLVPRDPAERQEARMLAHHLTSDRIVTRSSYRRSQELERARVLTSTRYRPETFRSTVPDGKLTLQEEEDLLEHLLLSRRSRSYSTPSTPANKNTTASSGTWQDGAEGLGSGGPQCVVCQSSPRTVLAWPCRCLSLCEDCRVSLAMNNFGTCVCCRQEVVGFSRLFVP